jgi:2'-5' RNA ligase
VTRPIPYAVWLVLSEESRERFQAIIDALSTRCGAPVFEPHITLLSGFTGDEKTLIAQARALALDIEPLELHLGQAKCLDEYYRCLFVEVALSRQLAYARDAAMRRFTPPTSAPFYPHLSLLYGDLPATKKEKLLDAIGRRFDEELRIEQLVLIAAPGAPDSWRRVELLALGGDESTI